MSNFRAFLILLSLCLWADSLNAEKLYIWNDKDGVLNITNSPSTVPPEIRAAKGIDKFKPLQEPAAPAAPAAPVVQKGEQPLPPPADEKAKETEDKRLHEAVEGLEKRNDSIKKLQEMLQKLAK